MRQLLHSSVIKGVRKEMPGFSLPLHGNLLVAHGGGPTAVINASLYGVISEAVQHKEIEHVYGARFGTEGLLDGRFIDLLQQPRSVLEALPFIPASAIGSSRRTIKPGDYERILEQFRRFNIRFFFFTGGNGTMLAACNLAQVSREIGWEMRVIGIPKTVDNDLTGTDHAPGFGSAARYLSTISLQLGRDNESLPFPICILETIGRNAGWLAASTVLAARCPEDGPQLVYVPEVTFREDCFLSAIDEQVRIRGRAFLAVSEGIRDERGELVSLTSSDTDRDGFGRPLSGNVSVHLANLISSKLKLRVRNEKPGLCTRVSTELVSPVDRGEAQLCGEFAAKRAIAGETGVMVSLIRRSSSPYSCEVGTTPLAGIGIRERALPVGFMNSSGDYPSEAFLEYARPLLGDNICEYPRIDSSLIAVPHPVSSSSTV